MGSLLNAILTTAQQHPDAVAVLDHGKPTTYTYLVQHAQGIAALLRQHHLQPQHTVALHLTKSADYIAALLGTWMAGGAFIPLDPALPPARKQHILADSSPAFILTATTLDNTTATVLTLPVNVAATHTFTPVPLHPNHLAYIIYTSGSTGTPKGVMVEHAGLLPVIQQQVELTGLTVGDRSLWLTSTNFDASVSDIATALLSGATLCIEPACKLQPIANLAQTLTRIAITYADIPPAYLPALRDYPLPPSLKTLLIGGEVCAPDVVREWAQKVRLINVYGPTEATICTSMEICHPETWQHPTIGIPLHGVTYQVVDANLQPVAIGQSGELLIGGNTLARGYLNQPELNATKLITLNGQRWYRTGDNVQRTTSGNFIFLGRIDRQFKVRGQLVEPAEIEAVLTAQPHVQRAAVLKRPLDATQPQSRAIVAAFVQGTSPIQPAAIRNALAATLPPWMIPNHIVQLETLPETPSGKPDYRALATLPLLTASTAPATHSSLTLQLATLMAQVLRIPLPTPTDDFISLGGDSLAIMDLILRAEREGLALDAEAVGRGLTLAELAEAMAAPANTPRGAMAASVLLRDATLPPELQHLPNPTVTPHPAPQHILLTGATGFLGSRLLAELLANSTATITCIVQAENPAHALQRIQTTAQRLATGIPPQAWSRVNALCGNISQPHLGLTDADYTQLLASVDAIHHCAAVVNTVLPYESLRAANVGGVENILRFALHGNARQLNYASTLSVFVATDQNTGTALEADHLATTQWVYGGYAQTKWVAEHLLRQVPSNRLAINHYRFGLITGDTATGLASASDFLALFIRGIAALGCIPQTWLNAMHVDITPRDFAAKAMAAIALKQWNHPGQTFHIANPQSASLGQLIQAMQAEGIAVNTVDEPQWQKTLANQPLTTPAVATLLALCRGNSDAFANRRVFDLFQATGITFDTRNASAILTPQGIHCPPPTEALLRTYVRHTMLQTKDLT